MYSWVANLKEAIKRGIKMCVETTSYERQGFYSLKKLDDVAILKVSKNLLTNAIDRAIENPLLKVFDHCSC